MRFNEHYSLKDKHAFLSPSQPHWLNYDGEKLQRVWRNQRAKELGTAMHALACDCIRLGVGLGDAPHTLNQYVNDAIELNMSPERSLYYSPYCFGTADTISFDEKVGLLRVHDLKTGKNKASIVQLRVYAALFCLEYGYDPNDLEIILRIYQNDEIAEEHSEGSLIEGISEKVKAFSLMLAELYEGGV